MEAEAALGERHELAALAALSHSLERLAFALAGADPDTGRGTAELVAVAAGERSAVAIALSYALRRQTKEPGPLAERAAALLQAALRAIPA